MAVKKRRPTMKRISLNHLLLFIMAFCTLSASAYNFKVDGIYYNINGNQATVTYKRYASSTATYSNDYAGDVVIPTTVTYNGTTYSVTSIGDHAFFGSSSLTSVTIPYSVTSIGEYAFGACTSMNMVTIPNSVTSIGISAFWNCSSLTSVTVPNSITEIDNNTFSGCTNLTSVTIPSSATSIGESAFRFCRSLTSITIPKSITSIGDNAFRDCDELNDVLSFIDNLTTVYIGTSVFKQNPSNYDERTLHVPVGTVSAYQANTKWSQYFGSIVEMENNIMATSIELNEKSAELTEGETLQLTATVLPEETTSKTVTWISSDDAIAMVDATGLVTAISPGSVTITATTTDGTNLSATCSVTVLPSVVYITSISLNETSAELIEGEYLQLYATVLPDNATNKEISWTTSNSSVATVTSNGIVEAKTLGSAIITATTTDGSGLSASCVVTVLKKTDRFYIEDFTINPGETLTVSILLDNEAEYTAFQCDLYLPEGLSVEQEDGDYIFDLTSRKGRDHNISSQLQIDGSIRIISYSPSIKAYSGNSGPLVTYSVTASSDFEGPASILLKNTLFTTVAGIEVPFADETCTVTQTVTNLRGDVNGDNLVTISDVTALIDLLLGGGTINNPAADCNNDTNVTISDVTALIDYLLGGTWN